MVNKVLLILIIILAIVAMVSLTLKITGHSPADITILYSLVALLIVGSFKLHYEIGRFDEFLTNAKVSFQHIREDNKNIQGDIKELKGILQRKIN